MTDGAEYLAGNVLGSLSCLVQRRGFAPSLRFFSGKGEFSLGVNIVSDSISPKLFRVRV